MLKTPSWLSATTREHGKSMVDTSSRLCATSGHASTGRSLASDHVPTRPHAHRRCHDLPHNLWYCGHQCMPKEGPMTQLPRIAALIADGFQEEECLVPRFALQLLGARVDMVSSAKAPVEIYSYFEKVGTYDVEYAIDAVDPQDFDGNPHSRRGEELGHLEPGRAHQGIRPGDGSGGQVGRLHLSRCAPRSLRRHRPGPPGDWLYGRQPALCRPVP